MSTVPTLRKLYAEQVFPELMKSRGAWYIETIRLKDTDKIAFTNGMMF